MGQSPPNMGRVVMQGERAMLALSASLYKTQHATVILQSKVFIHPQGAIQKVRAASLKKITAKRFT